MKSFTCDIDLVDRLQKGDVVAFDLLYEKYSKKLYLFALKYLRSTAEAEELVQSVFLKVWENHKNLRKESSFKSYLFTIAYNDMCKLFRKRNYLQKFLSDTIVDNPHSSFQIEESIDYNSLLERIQQIINKLPERQKIIFLKSRKEYKSTKEIAVELRLSTGTVDNYISESLKFIRSRLRNEDFGSLFFFFMFFL